MNKMRFLTISVIVLFLLNAATLFFLFRNQDIKPGRRPPGNGKDAAQYIITALKLDSEQQQQFAQLREKHHSFAVKAEDENKRLHDLYFNMLKSDSQDQGKIDSVATLIGQQRKILAQNTFEHFQQLRAICHEDQKKLFDATIDDIIRMVAGPHPPPGASRSPGGAAPPRKLLNIPN